MASINAVSARGLLPLPKLSPKPAQNSSFNCLRFPQNQITRLRRRIGDLAIVSSSVADELDAIAVRSGDRTDQQEGLAMGLEREGDRNELVNQLGGFSTNEGQFSFDGFSSGVASTSSMDSSADAEMEKVADRILNAMIVLAAGSFAINKLLTIDQDYWQGWTLYEILRYAPQHSWNAYEEALKTNPVFAKMTISGVVYSLGDWIAQCYEGKPLFEFDRARMFRSGLVGFTLHGSLSHFYYQFCEELFPFKDWWVVPAKVVFDQTLWSAVWNSIYFTVLGFLRFESPASIFKELTSTFWPMLTAGWKLWPFAHIITYGVIPLEQRLLWVDCVELIWVTILSTYSNEKSEARIGEDPSDANSSSLPLNSPEQE